MRSRHKTRGNDAQRADVVGKKRLPRRGSLNAIELRLEEFEPRLLLSVPPNILLTPAVLSSLRQQAAANTPQWQAFKSQLDNNLYNPIVNSYQGSDLSRISDNALGYQILKDSDPGTAANYADKAIAGIKTALHDFQKGGWGNRQFLARGDGTTTTFTLPNADWAPGTLVIYLGNVTVYPVVHGAQNGQDDVDFYQKFLKVSNTSDGSADYTQGTDWLQNPDYPENQIDWSRAGHQPASGATYYITSTAAIYAGTTSFSVNGTLVTLPVAPTKSQAVFAQYIYGKHSADGSTLAFQESSANDGGFNSIYIDTSYTSRYLGKHVAMGLDWLDSYVGLTPALKSEADAMLVRWFNYLQQYGYAFNSPASNYGAGSYVSNVMTALALSNRDPNGPQLLASVLSYRQNHLVPDLTNPTSSLAGGFWAEGWNYGPLAVQNLLLAGLALEADGQIPQATAERGWASQVTQHLVSAQPTSGTIYDGGDWYAYPAPFPAKETFYLLAGADVNPTTRAYDNYILQHYSGSDSHDFVDLLYHDPAAPASYWSSLPLQYFATGTGLLTARSDWGSNPNWVSLQIGNLLDADHQTFTPGQLQIQRGGDDLLVNATSAAKFLWPKNYYGNTVIVDDNGDGAQTYRYAPGFWYGSPGVVTQAYEGTAGYTYLSGDYHAAYSPSSAPGSGGSTSELTRQMVYLRPGFVLVYDRVTTIKASYAKQLHWHFLNAPVVNGNSFTVSQGGSRLFGQTFSTLPLSTTEDTLTLDGTNIAELVTQSTAVSASARFVTAFQIADSSVGGMVATRQVLTDDQRMEGVQIGGDLVLFGRNGNLDLSTPVTYQVTGTAAVYNLLTNLTPGQSFQILVDGAALTSVTASSQGTISFTTSAGNHTVQVGTGGTPVPWTTHLGVSASGSATAGSPFTVTVIALDASGNAVPSYGGTVHLASADLGAILPADYTFTAADAGAHTFTVSLDRAGRQSVSVMDVFNGSITGSQSVSVAAAQAARLTASGPTSPVSPGAPFAVTVTAFDAFGNLAAGYTGTLHFTSSDSSASLPSDYTFTAADAGTHTFSAVLAAGGSQSLTAADRSASALSATVNVLVAAAPSAHLSLSLPAAATAGGPFPVTVQALDVSGKVMNGYRGTVHFISSDLEGKLPTDYTFTAADAGAHTFTATLIQVGSQSLTAMDLANGALTASAAVSVNAAAGVRLGITGPGTAASGAPFAMIVTVYDVYSNIATAYTGTVHFNCSDFGAILPVDYIYQAADAGRHTFGVALRIAGSQTVTVTDLSPSPLSVSATVSVIAGVSRLGLITPATATAGSVSPVTLQALDASGNVMVSYRGTVHFTSSDPGATPPADYTFTAADAGVHTFMELTFVRAGWQTVSAADVAAPSITTSGTVAVTPAAASRLGIAAPIKVVSGTPFPVTVTAYDVYGNVATGYTGTVHFTSSDLKATLPPDYTFRAADQGQHVIQATLSRQGSRSVNANDTANLSVTGTATVSVGRSALGGFGPGSPPTLSAVTSGGSSVLFTVAADGSLYRHDSTTGWARLGSFIRSVSAVVSGSGEIVVFAITADQAMFRLGVASGWQMLGAPGSVAQVSAATDASGRPVVFVLTTDGSVTEYRDASGWLASPIGGRGSVVQVIAAPGDRVVALSADQSVYEHDNRSGWFRLTSAGFARSISVSAEASGNLVLFAVSQGNSLFRYDPTSGWTKLGDSITSLTSGTDNTGRANVVAVTMAGDVFEWSGSSLRRMTPPNGTPVNTLAADADRLFAVAPDGSVEQHDNTFGWIPLTSAGFA